MLCCKTMELEVVSAIGERSIVDVDQSRVDVVPTATELFHVKHLSLAIVEATLSIGGNV